MTQLRSVTDTARIVSTPQRQMPAAPALLAKTTEAVENTLLPKVRKIPLTAPFYWLCLALVDFAANLQASLFYGFCYAIMGITVTRMFTHAYPFTSVLTSGFLLLGPFLAIGVYELSRCHMYGIRVSLASTLTIWRHNSGNIALFALVLAIIFMVWARASLIMFAMFYTDSMPTLTGFMTQVLALENIKFLVVYFSVGLLFAFLVFAVSVVSIPLMLDRNQDAVTAMLTSIMALRRNPGPCLLWAVIITVATSIGFLSFHIGLIPLIPLIGHATWHAYIDLVEPAE